VSAGAEAVVPPVSDIELPDEITQASAGRFKVRGQLGDLIAKPVELVRPLACRDTVRGAQLHRCHSS
jgi:hypothetical protein